MAVQSTSLWQRRSSRQLISGILKQVTYGRRDMKINGVSMLSFPVRRSPTSIAACAVSAALPPCVQAIPHMIDDRQLTQTVSCHAGCVTGRWCEVHIFAAARGS